MKTALLVVLLIAFQISYSQEIKVMTYNIKCDYNPNVEDNWNSRKEGMIELINHYAPDLMGVQEAVPSQMAFLDSVLLDYDFIGVGRDDGKQKGEYSAIFYRKEQFNVIEQNTFWLSDTPEAVSIGWDAAYQRICTFGLFEDQISKKKFWVFNTHFDHVGDQARINSAALIINKVKELNQHDLPVFIMGDFNLTPETEAILTLQNKFNDSRITSLKPPYGPSGTFNGFNEENVTTRIDYIFTQKAIVQTHTHIDDRLQTGKWISDHLPVLIEAEF